MLEADFSQQNEDEREAPLQPCHHRLQFRQSRGRGGWVFLGLLPGAVPLCGRPRSRLLEQGGGPVLQGLVVEVVMMVMVVRGRSGEIRSDLCAVRATFLPGRRSHLDENFRGGAQD